MLSAAIWPGVRSGAGRPAGDAADPDTPATGGPGTGVRSQLIGIYNGDAMPGRLSRAVDLALLSTLTTIMSDSEAKGASRSRGRRSAALRAVRGKARELVDGVSERLLRVNG
jgi:hypothetical protein